MFDFSKNQSNFFDLTNRKVIGKMKDVHKGKPICEFIGLKSKMHCILSDDGEKSNTKKGVNAAIELNKYEDILLSKKVIRYKMRIVQSKKRKISLSCFDETRYILDGGVHTLAYFHKNLKN